jgi:hypothetical protein
MHSRISAILLCGEHFLPGESPDSWRCKLAAFESTTRGREISTVVQFLAWFAALMLLRWAFTSWRRWRGRAIS